MKHSQITFLKLGGSLITDKNTPLTPLPDVIQRISDEIAMARHQNPSLHLVIGHGSGSFGHAIASQHQTQSGGNGEGYWLGFAEVWEAARKLNQVIIQNLCQAGLPVIAFPPSAGMVTEDKHPISWDTRPLQLALSHHLMPVVQGDVVFDTVLGGTILSTEQVFQHLANDLLPDRILLAGLDKGVYQNLAHTKGVISHITPNNFNEALSVLSGAKTQDVTGGMLAKVRVMLALAQAHPGLEVQIFSGTEPGNIYKALMGEKLGTRITA